MKYRNKPSLVLFFLAGTGITSTAKHTKGSKSNTQRGLGWDPKQWEEFDITAKSFDAIYTGDYDSIDTTEISEMYIQEGSVFLFDLGSFGSLIRRLGAVITLSEIRTIWYELSPVVTDNNGIIMKSGGDTLQMYFEKVSDGLRGTRAMYLTLIARWRGKVALACDNADPPDWCGDEEQERKRFFNTAAMGGDFGDIILIPKSGRIVDAIGAAVNNAYFADEEAEHGESIIGETALQSLLVEAGADGPVDACSEGFDIPWTAGVFGIHRFIVKVYPFGCYYTVCFDEECKIPDDE